MSLPSHVLAQVHDLHSAHLTLLEQGKPLESVQYLERAFILQRDVLGPNSDAVANACAELVNSLNSIAMGCLRSERFHESLDLLRRAEILTDSNSYISDRNERLKHRAVTYNNLGCFYKRKAKLHAALQYLEKALKIELSTPSAENPAGTHLNLCATLSQLGRHGPAMQHAQCALDLLSSNDNDDAGPVRAIAYHNLAVEQEHLGLYESCAESYKRSLDIAREVYGQDHEKTTVIRENFELARDRAARMTRESPPVPLSSSSRKKLTSKNKTSPGLSRLAMYTPVQNGPKSGGSKLPPIGSRTKTMTPTPIRSFSPSDVPQPLPGIKRQRVGSSESLGAENLYSPLEEPAERDEFSLQYREEALSNEDSVLSQQHEKARERQQSASFPSKGQHGDIVSKMEEIEGQIHSLFSRVSEEGAQTPAAELNEPLPSVPRKDHQKNSSMSQSIPVKSFFHDEVRIFSVHIQADCSSFEVLQEAVFREWNEWLRIGFVDVEGDFVSITSDESLAEAIHQSVMQQQRYLRLRLNRARPLNRLSSSSSHQDSIEALEVHSHSEDSNNNHRRHLAPLDLHAGTSAAGNSDKVLAFDNSIEDAAARRIQNMLKKASSQPALHNTKSIRKGGSLRIIPCLSEGTTKSRSGKAAKNENFETVVDGFEHAAASRVQRMYRLHLSRSEKMRQVAILPGDLSDADAAVKIQAVYRGYHVRAHTKQKRNSLLLFCESYSFDHVGYSKCCDRKWGELDVFAKNIGRGFKARFYPNERLFRKEVRMFRACGPIIAPKVHDIVIHNDIYICIFEKEEECLLEFLKRNILSESGNAVISEPVKGFLLRLFNILAFLHERRVIVTDVSFESFRKYAGVWKIAKLDCCHKEDELWRIGPSSVWDPPEVVSARKSGTDAIIAKSSIDMYLCGQLVKLIVANILNPELDIEIATALNRVTDPYALTLLNHLQEERPSDRIQAVDCIDIVRYIHSG